MRVLRVDGRRVEQTMCWLVMISLLILSMPGNPMSMVDIHYQISDIDPTNSGSLRHMVE